LQAATTNDKSMKSKFLAILLFTSCIIAACTRSSLNTQLVQADSLIQKLPDSALHFLQSIQSKEFHSAADRAYYALLLTQVKDKNFILQTEDSLIRIAVQYYDSTKNTAMQARAHYYLGCIWRNKDDHPEALKEFFKAITYSKKVFDNSLSGHIYNNIAYLYYLQRLNGQADSIYQIAEKLAIVEKDSILWADALSQRGMIGIRKGKECYQEAEQKILHAFNISCNINQRNMIAKTAYSLSLLYGRMNMGEKAVEFAKLNISNQYNSNALDRAYLVLGDAYYKISQYDSASIYLNKSLYSEDYYTKAGAYMRLADIAKKQGQLEKALEMERKYSSYLDSAQQKQQSAEIVTTEKNILIQRKQSEFKANLGQVYYYITAGITIFLALFLVLWKRYKKEIINFKQKEIELNKKTEELLQKKNEQISFLQKEIELHNYSQTEKQTLKEELHTLKTERQVLLKESYEHSEVYVKMKRIIQSYKKTDKSSEHFDEEDWKQLIAETDIRWNDITIRLATRYPLSQDEIHLCCLYLTDIPTSHLRYIMECSRDAIYKKTKKILEQKMKCADKSTSLRDILEKLL
jgi:tetratricopeptide (TPR) repeat protein